MASRLAPLTLSQPRLGQECSRPTLVHRDPWQLIKNTGLALRSPFALILFLTLLTFTGTHSIRAQEPTLPVPATPTALLRTLLRSGRPDWTSFYRDPVPTTFPSRAQNALTLGSLYTDGFLACLAEDSQQIHNLARDLLAVAKPLGLTANPTTKDLASQRFDRSKSLTDCADQKKWEELRLEIEASQAAAEALLRKLEDPHLADLLALGSWFRAQQILAAALVDRRDDPSEEALRLSLRSHLPKIRRPGSEKKTADDPTWARLETQAAELEPLLTSGSNANEFDPCKWLKLLSSLLGSPAKRKTAPASPCTLE